MDNKENEIEYSKNDLLKYISEREIDMNDIITLFFVNYIDRGMKGILYSKNDLVPQNLIKIYYSNITVPRFKSLWENFREDYINNENDLEDVHSDVEREGLGLVYDYIIKKEDYESLNMDLYQVQRIHKILFSKCPYPEFGGKFRTEEIFLPNSGVETVDWRMLPNEFSKLYNSTNELIKEGIKLGKRRNPNTIISYINACLDLNCKIIEMHPFSDGNGRTTRAFTNMLFRIANIPPVYVKSNEREIYGMAINKAIVDKDPSEFRKFYYYKICDSIVELDILKRQNINKKSKTK